MTTDIHIDSTKTTDTQPLANDDDLHLKVSILVTNGSNTLIKLHADTDVPYALKKECLILASTKFQDLLMILLVDPACTEMRRLLSERYEALCARDQTRGQLVTADYSPVPAAIMRDGPAFVPKSPPMQPREVVSCRETEDCAELFITPGLKTKAA
jgi:hypothetical protein